jgi:hypothetical protein
MPAHDRSSDLSFPLIPPGKQQPLWEKHEYVDVLEIEGLLLLFAAPGGTTFMLSKSNEALPISNP